MATTQRDPELTRKQLLEWFIKKLPENATDVDVSHLVIPTSSGFSNETFMCDLSWTEAGASTLEPVVIRVMPSGFRVFKHYDLERQFKTMQLLGDTPLPVPKVLWMEHDPSVLGEEFYVMDRIDGKIPSDSPTYHQAGWMKEEASAKDCEELWWSGIEAMAELHKLDYKKVGFDFLESDSDKSYAEQHIEFYEEIFEWGGNGKSYPPVERGFKWLRENLPEEKDLAICWGDARLGNLIFGQEDNQVAAVLDWEMVELGNPEQDLAWWLFFDDHHSRGIGSPRLEGLPSREETIARWEEITGRKAKNLDYYEIQAATSFAMLLVRVGIGLREAGLLPEESDFEKNNAATRMLDEMIEKQG